MGQRGVFINWSGEFNKNSTEIQQKFSSLKCTVGCFARCKRYRFYLISGGSQEAEIRQKLDKNLTFLNAISRGGFGLGGNEI